MSEQILGFAGANSATYFVRDDGSAAPATGRLGATDWAALPAGRLKTVLTATYGSTRAFVEAFVAEGGSVVVTTAEGTSVPTAGLRVIAGAASISLIAAAGVGTIGSTSVRIQLGYSASA